MENLIKIINGRLDEQSLLGKDSLTINEIKNILEQVNVLVSKVESIDTKETEKDFCTKEQREAFNEIVSKFTETKKSDKYPDSVFYMVGDYVYMERNSKTNNFYIRYCDFWAFFETKFNLNYQEISGLLQGLLKHHLNCEVNTTFIEGELSTSVLEEHLNYNVNSVNSTRKT